jgi:hypothetical protein
MRRIVSWRDPAFWRGVAWLLALALAFALGYLYGVESAVAPIVIEKCSA